MMHVSVFVEELNAVNEQVGTVQVSDGPDHDLIRMQMGNCTYYFNVDQLHAAVAAVMHTHALNNPDEVEEGDY